MQAVGFILFILGCAGMDSSKVAVPAVMVLVSLIILKMAAAREITGYGIKTDRRTEYTGKQKRADKKNAA